MKTSKHLLDYLAICSETSLQAFELARLNEVANLHQQLTQQIAATVDEIVEADTQARLARWMGGRRRKSPRRPSRSSRQNSHMRETQYALPLLAAVENGRQIASPANPERLLRLPKLSPSSTASQPSPRLRLASAG
ncbi:MAG TPA: hypothetical protein VGR72_10290 [Candidatus Acidoferrales bacterium]|nr:hypothetical protein [Candidatus Acidoferrales bacterium]